MVSTIFPSSENRSMASSQLQKNIFSQFDVNISVSSLNTFRDSASLTRIPETKEITQYQIGIYFYP
jgi:hypothetical protein